MSLVLNIRLLLVPLMHVARVPGQGERRSASMRAQVTPVAVASGQHRAGLQLPAPATGEVYRGRGRRARLGRPRRDQGGATRGR